MLRQVHLVCTAGHAVVLISTLVARKLIKMADGNDSSRSLIKVRWPHGGWIVWNYDLCKWEHVDVEPKTKDGSTNQSANKSNAYPAKY